MSERIHIILFKTFPQLNNVSFLILTVSNYVVLVKTYPILFVFRSNSAICTRENKTYKYRET